MKNNKFSFRDIIYLEWLYPVRDYFKSSELKELIFDVFVPILLSVGIYLISLHRDAVAVTTEKLASMLFSVTSVLIGFSIMLVTILLTSGGDGVNELKKRTVKKELYGKNITLFQKLHIQFIYSLVTEVLLLLVILFFYFMHDTLDVYSKDGYFLLVFVFGILNILFSLIREITNIYFSFYRNDIKKG